MREESSANQNQEATDRKVASPGRSPETSFGRWVWEWTKSILIAFILFLFIRAFVVEAFQIPTASMEKTLLVGDFLLVNKMVYGAEIPGTDLQLPAFSEPSWGDVIVFEPPKSAHQPPRTSYVKRIVGIPGDTLSMMGGVLYRNGAPVEESYIHRSGRSRDVRSPGFDWQRAYLVDVATRRRHYRPTRDNWGPILVPPENYFVLGDNRRNSQDSRYWGFVPAVAIRGKPLLIYYSYDRRTVSHFRWLTEIRWNRVLTTVE